MNNIALIRPTAIKDSLGWFHPADSVFRKKKTTTTTSRSSEMTNRWIVNSSGQYIDSDAVVDPPTTAVPAIPWGTEDDGATVSTGHNNANLANDLARLKISANSDADAQVEPSTRLSRPTSKLTPSSAAAVAQIATENNANNTSSSLDSSSSNSSSSPHTPDHSHLHHQISHSRGASADTPNHHHHPHVLPQPYITSQHPQQSTPSSGNNSNSNTLLTHLRTSSTSTVESFKERPHSFSGGLSTADLRRLSQGGPAGSPIAGADDQPQSPWAQEQLSYPSLAQQQRPFHNFNYPASNDINTTTTTDDDQHYNRSFSSDPPPHPHQLPSPRTQFMPVSSQARAIPMNYRRTYTPQGPSPLGYGHHTTHHSLGNTQHLYEMMLPAGLGDSHHHHPSSLSRGLGASAGGSGLQQSPSVFRASHHHSASDPSALRDPNTLALLNNNMQTFSPGMFQPGMHSMHPPPPPIYPGQFYAQEMAMQQLLNARMQAAQAYTGPYGMAAATGLGAPASSPQPAMSMDNVNSGLASPGSSNGAGSGAGGTGGPSANNRKLGLYKTELCRSWEEKGSCRYGAKCQFAHGEEELRKVARHPKYKTEICKTFWVSGSCPYGKRCCFIHTELSSVQPGASDSPEMTPQLSSSSPSSNGNAVSNGNIHHRERSNSDPDASASVSLLTRISQRSQNNQDHPSPTTTPASSNPPPSTTAAPSSFSHTLPLTSRPPTGSLRVDTTNVEPNLSLKQNKSAYPTFASNGILLGGASGAGAGAGSLEFGGNGVGSGGLGEGGRGLGAGVGLNGAVGRFRHEAVPVTAGPDLGRHNLARMEIVGYPTHQRKGSASSITNAHHSLGGSDDLSFSPSPPGSSGHSYSLSTSSDTASTTTSTATNTTSSSVLSPAQPTPTRLNGHGHVRTGSAGTLNWGSSFTGAASGGVSSSASRNSSHPLSTSVGSTTWVGELTARVGNEKTWA